MRNSKKEPLGWLVAFVLFYGEGWDGFSLQRYAYEFVFNLY